MSAVPTAAVPPEAPLLSRKDIEEQLDRLCGVPRHHHLFAFHGTGSEDIVDLARGGRFEVVPVRSELELRERMPSLDRPDAEQARMAFLVPFTNDVPLDLAGRFALNGRVQRIGPEARLRRMFQASEVESDVRGSALGVHLLAASTPRTYRAPAGGRLTLAAAWAAWLGAEWSVEVEGGLALDTLLGWAALDARGPSFGASHGEGPLRAGLKDHLKSQVGPAGPWVWSAWERDRGRTALELAILLEPLVASADGGVRMWARQATRATFQIDDPEIADQVARALGAAAGGALRHLQAKTGAAEVRALVNVADARVDEPEVRAALAPSTRLPAGWRHRLDALGDLLAAAAAAPNAEAVERAAAAQRKLEGHDFFAEDDSKHLARRAEMAVRLLAWLAEQPESRLEPGMQLHADVATLGRWYAEEGGFVDRARRGARGPDDGRFGAGVAAVVRVADELRTRLDLRFAKALGHWVQAGCPADVVLPIDRAVKHVGLRFLEESAERKLLVLLFDGMAWAQATELMASLGERPAPWGPIAWHAKATKGGGMYPVVIAGLPTVTEVSRAAVFAGRPMAAGSPTGTEKDAERWLQNKDVGKFSVPPDVPRLLLRSEGHTPGGEASNEALSLVGDTTRRVVALVINAIDASLKGDAQVDVIWTPDRIRSLEDILARAREAGRTVLMCTDHGHVPSDRLVSAGSFPGAGARWRPLPTPDAPVAPYEIALAAGPNVWAPKGAGGVALIADDAHRYGGGAHAGEHGGASLAEVVAPFVLIGCDDGLGVEDDRALDVRPAPVPGWWHFEVQRGVPLPESPVRVRPGKTVRRPDERQLTFLPEPPAPPSPAPAAAVSSPAPAAAARPESALARSAVLEARAPSVALRRKVVLAVEFLLERKGVASDAAFAQALGVLEFRVAGLVSLLQEVLNADGYQVLRYDHTGRQVHLDKEKLAQQFEVTL